MMYKAPMKIRKPTFKWLSLMLVFFMATAGLAQAAAFCKGKCCQEPAAREKPVVPELPLNLETSLDALLPYCHLSDTSNVQRATVTEGEPCRDEGTPSPSCCHLGKTASRVNALASQGYSWGTDRLFNIGLVVCIQSDAFLNEDQRHLVVDRGSLQPRAAPVPLYLKNTSFIC